MSDDKIIHLRTGEPLALSVKKMDWKSKCLGGCKKVYVDEETRTLSCKACGRTIDPFDYLWKWACEGDNRLAELKLLKDELRVAHADLANLKTQIRNARATVRRHS